jgi:signal transduction histidine kinase
MRLASKLFLTSLLVIVVLAGIGVLSLRAVGRLVSVNREIATQSLPALRLTVTARDAMLALGRLETRFLVLQDPQYAALWREQAERAAEDLARLRDLMATRQEARRLETATTDFEHYRALVAQEHALLQRNQRTRALRIAETEARVVAERVEASLDELAAATYARVESAQVEAARLERRTWVGVALALGAAVFLATMGTALVAVRVTRSLGQLSAATAAVAAGAVHDPLPVDRRDEIGALARSFNTMASQLRQLDDDKQQLFASISHELRSPLTSVREAAHLLREEVPGPLNAKQARLVDIVGRSCDRLLGLVNRLLEVARLRAGMLPLERRHLDLDRVVTRALEELRPQADEAGVVLARHTTGENFHVVGDEERLVQVVVNLVANAVRFTPKDGRVTVVLRDAGPEVELAVEDTGVGIPASALPHVFDSYRQAHRGRGGTGLGLTIVRGVVHAHDGRVSAESEEGRGSRFTVTLPRGREAA